MASDPYSRLVVFLKVALPLVALGILSTLFLLSSRIEPGESIPFAENEVERRIRSEQVTGPLFSGVTTGGDKVTFTADQIVTTQGNTNTALNPVAHLDFATGGSVELVAEHGDVDLANDFLRMSGDVVIDSTTGYIMRTETLTSRLSLLEIVAPGDVRANGPGGTLDAGTMRITERTGDDGVHLFFTNGVKLVYEPKETE